MTSPPLSACASTAADVSPRCRRYARPAVDVLVIVGAEPPAPRLLARANHYLSVTGEQASPDQVATLRARIPRALVVVIPSGRAAKVAAQLRRPVLPVTLYTDDQVTAEAGIDVSHIADQGAPMEVADTLVDLFGNTPLVRLDRIGRD